MKNFLEKIRKLLISKLNNKNLIENAKHLAKALSFTLAVTLIIIGLTNLLYQEKTIIKRGYEAEISRAKPKTENVDGISVGSLPDLTVNKSVDIASLIKTADLKKGEKIFKKCAACHTREKGAANKIGPNLYGIVNKTKTSTSDFKYSDALRSKGGKWTIQDLDKFLTNPKDFAPGTKMTFAGLKKDKDRANIIAYLQGN